MKLIAFNKRFLHFTETLVYNLSKFYFICSVGELILCAYAVSKGLDGPLNTFITEQNTTFRNTVGVAIVKFLVENIFQYNSFGKNKNSETNSEEIVKSDSEMMEEENGNQLETETNE